MSDKNNNSLEERRVAYYSALVNAWITTRIEKDKQLLNLSAAGIGLIIIFQPKLCNIIEFFLWGLAGGFFLFAIVFLLSVLSENSDLIEAQIHEPESILKKKLDQKIKVKTKIAGWLFVLGAILTFTLAISQTTFVHLKFKQETVKYE